MKAFGVRIEEKGMLKKPEKTAALNVHEASQELCAQVDRFLLSDWTFDLQDHYVELCDAAGFFGGLKKFQETMVKNFDSATLRKIIASAEMEAQMQRAAMATTKCETALSVIRNFVGEYPELSFEFTDQHEGKKISQQKYLAMFNQAVAQGKLLVCLISA